MRSPVSPSSSRLEDEVRYHLAARQELGPEMDEELVQSFARQVRDVIAEEVARQTKSGSVDDWKLRNWRRENVAMVLGIGIPLMLIAGLTAHLAGIIAVCVMLAAVSTSLSGGRRRHGQ